MNPYSFFSRYCHPTILRRVAILPVTLAWCSLAFCGEIHDAAKAGDLEKVKTLLKDKPGLVLSKDDKYGLTPLHLAAFSGHQDVAELLLTSKAEVNAKDNLGLTPLHMAALGGHSRTSPDLVAARFLLKPGRKYEQAVKAFEPYDSIKEENPEARAAGRALIAEGKAAGPKHKTFIYVNNRLEGNAISTIAAMVHLA